MLKLLEWMCLILDWNVPFIEPFMAILRELSQQFWFSSPLVSEASRNRLWKLQGDWSFNCFLDLLNLQNRQILLSGVSLSLSLSIYIYHCFHVQPILGMFEFKLQNLDLRLIEWDQEEMQERIFPTFPCDWLAITGITVLYSSHSLLQPCWLCRCVPQPNLKYDNVNAQVQLLWQDRVWCSPKKVGDASSYFVIVWSTGRHRQIILHIVF